MNGKTSDLERATRIDALTHAIVSVVYLIVIAVLGVTHVIDGAGVVGMIVGGGGVVTALSVGDVLTYGPKKPPRALSEP